jgi:hypothetical protein
MLRLWDCVQVFCVWLTPNQDLAYVLATGYVAASILLSGFFLLIDDMKLAVMRGLSYLSYTKRAHFLLFACQHSLGPLDLSSVIICREEYLFCAAPEIHIWGVSRAGPSVTL